jgi:phenylpropionate dioxygenase-like ring-hydroxylating dioxygenase large terminal subunit
MSTLTHNEVFNRDDRFAEGWYWALPSHALKKGRIEPLRLLGRDLVAFRGDDEKVVVMDAYCPHMGAHLAEGRVDGNGVRCFFHDWKFDANGECVEVPCLERAPKARITTWTSAEHLGMVWVWAGEGEPGPLPYVPELEHEECDVLVSNRFVKECHPNVVLINAIDEHHFNSVHNLPVDLYMETKVLSPRSVMFSNTTEVPDSHPLLRLYGKLYAGPLTYSMCYHYASSGTVTVGPDAFHFHIMFALRPIDGGKAEGQTLLITKRREGRAGQAFNRIVLGLSKVVGDYFAKGDTQVFRTIRFELKTPTKADHAIIDFIRHCDAQPAREWGTWKALSPTPKKSRKLGVLHG